MFKKIFNYVAGVEKSVESIAIGFFDTIKKLEQHAADQFAAAFKHAEAVEAADAKRIAAQTEAERASELAVKIKAFVA